MERQTKSHEMQTDCRQQGQQTGDLTGSTGYWTGCTGDLTGGTGHWTGCDPYLNSETLIALVLELSPTWLHTGPIQAIWIPISLYMGLHHYK